MLILLIVLIILFCSCCIHLIPNKSVTRLVRPVHVEYQLEPPLLRHFANTVSLPLTNKVGEKSAVAVEVTM